jgi:hypothetical protein
MKIIPTLQHLEAASIHLRMKKELARFSCTDNPPLIRQIPTCRLQARNIILPGDLNVNIPHGNL